MRVKAKALIHLDSAAVESDRLAPLCMGLVRRLTVLAAATTLALLAFAPSAFAAPHHVYDSSFGSAGTGDGQFGAASPSGIDSDQGTGALYVADTANSRVLKFDSSGAFVSAWGWGVDDGSSAAQVCTSGCEAGISGAGAGQFNAPTFIAVDNSSGPSDGDVYIGDVNTNLVQKFDSSGNLISTWGAGGQLDGSTATDGPFGAIAGIAVDPAGGLGVFDTSTFMYQFAEDGTFTTDFATVRGTSAIGLAADSDGNFFKVNGDGSVERFDGTGGDLGQINLSAATGIAIDPATDDLYVAATDHVERFAFNPAGDVIQPDTSTCTPGSFSGCNPTETFGSPDITAAAGLAIRGSDAHAYVSDPGNTEIDRFDFIDPPVAETDPATSVHHTSAVLNGHLDPGADPAFTACEFEYGTSIAYGSTVACDQLAPITSPADVSAPLTSLTPGTTYHYRLSVTSTSNGVITGADETFTPAAFPVARDEIAAFGPDGTSATTFGSSSPDQLAFHQSDRKLYALDKAAPGIYGFDASGPPSFPPLTGFTPLGVVATGGDPGLAVDNTALASAGNVYYLSEANGLYGFDSTGAALGGAFPVPRSDFGDPCGAAVDPSGNVWVADFNALEIKEFSSAGAPLGSVDVSAQGNPCRVAFDTNGDLYVGRFNGTTRRYTAASSYTSSTEIDANSPSSGDPQALAVDPTTHHLFISYAGKVKEFDAAGSLLGTFATGIPSADLRGIAADASSGEVYVADRGNHLIRRFAAGILQTFPTVTPGDPTALTATSATLNAKVDPETFDVTDCHFDWGATAAYGNSAPCSPDPGSGSGDVAVSADLTGLDPGTAYHFRISASNASGTSTGPDQALTTLGPRVSDVQATQITSNDAKLSAQVNPQGSSTTYHFEYGTTTAYGQSTPESGSVGSDTSNHPAVKIINGLTPNTTYHFRIVATNSVGVTHSPDVTFTTFAGPPEFTPCANDAFRTGAGARLPDCRAYEQASPTDKNGSDVAGQPNFVQASEAGDGITFFSLAGLPGAEGAQEFPIFLAQRGASSWSTQGILPPPSYGNNASFSGWTPDLAHTFTSISTTTAGFPATFLDRDSSDGSIDTIVPQQPGGTSVLVGASADNSKIYFQNAGPGLTPDAAPGQDNLYLWDRNTQTVSLAGVLPAGEGGGAPAAGSFGGSITDGTFGQVPTQGGANATFNTQDQHVVSDDGNKVYFTAGGSAQIYLRNNAAGPSPSTEHISAALDGTVDPNGPKFAVFRAATPDGSKAFFTSCEKLTDDSTAFSSPSEDDCDNAEGQDLYVYTGGSDPDLTDLTADANPSNPHGADVRGVLGISDDGSYVYFAANGVLAAGATPGDCHRDPSVQEFEGACNLYLNHDGDTTFIGRMSSESPIKKFTDDANWQGYDSTFNQAAQKTARVSADGKTLLFRSLLPLTGYDNFGPRCENGDFNAPGPTAGLCVEFFRYSADDDSLLCLTCNPGRTPNGRNDLQFVRNPGPSSPLKQGSFLTRNLSADGNRFFWDSTDKFVAADTNGIRDVYEWEAEGTGSCDSGEFNGGCVYLLSTGAAESNSFFADASSSGDDAFIFTRSALVPADQDQLIDVYDAGVGRGLASQHAAPPAGCTGDGCQGAGTPPPNDPSSGSSTVNGPGNQGKNRGGTPTTATKKKCKKGKKGRKCRKKKARRANTIAGGSK